MIFIYVLAKLQGCGNFFLALLFYTRKSKYAKCFLQNTEGIRGLTSKEQDCAMVPTVVIIP